MTTQSVNEKFRIQREKLSLQLKMEIESDDNQHCNICNGCLDKNEQEIVNTLVELKISVSRENGSALLYTDNFVHMKTGREIVDDTNFYCEKYSNFMRILSRGGSTYPSYHIVQWMTFCLAFLMSMSGLIGRNFLINNLV